MLGDDVASTGLNMTMETAKMTGNIVLKTAEIISELIKMISQSENKEFEVCGEQKMLSSLRKGGETDSVTLSKDDFEKFREINKKQYGNDIAYFAAEQLANPDFVDVHFLKSDDSAFKAVMNSIVNEKLNLPDQEFKMIEMDKFQVEGFQEYCIKNNIQTNFLETKQGNIKCIFNSCDEQKIQKAAENMSEIRNELKNTVVEVQKDKNGRLNFAVSDSTHGKSGKSITMRFCEKEKFQRVLQEQFGYDRMKSVEAANILSAKLTSEQSKYFRSGSKLTEQMDYYEHNVKFENDNLLTSDYTFTQLKMKNDNDMKLSITDKDGNYVILTQSNTDRNLAEENIRKYLQISDSEKLDAILEKAEKLKFADPAQKLKRGSYIIERTSKNSMIISDGERAARIDISDTNSARNILINKFGISQKQADKIIADGRKQRVTDNLLKNAGRLHGLSSGSPVKDRHINRGSRK